MLDEYGVKSTLWMHLFALSPMRSDPNPLASKLTRAGAETDDHILFFRLF